MTKKIVDTHVHVWDIDKAEYLWLKNDTSLLNQTWQIEQLEKERKEAGITAGVLVQAAGNVEDTDNMLQVARRTGWIAGVVTWLPLTDTVATGKVLEEKYLADEYFKGARHQIHDEPDPRWLLQPPVIDSLKILARHDIPYDVVAVVPAHIETALELAQKVPGLRMVFDHLSQPPIASREKFGKWGELMKTAATHKNFYAKISGLGTASGNFKDRKADDLEPYIEFALKHFGTNRCLCGGDWPVSLLAGSYTQVWETYTGILGRLLNGKEQEQVFYTNAKDFYSLHTI